jgi:hypothetical protein
MQYNFNVTIQGKGIYEWWKFNQHTQFCDGEILYPSEISCVIYLHKQLKLENSQMMFHTHLWTYFRNILNVCVYVCYMYICNVCQFLKTCFISKA